MCILYQYNYIDKSIIININTYDINCNLISIVIKLVMYDIIVIICMFNIKDILWIYINILILLNYGVILHYNILIYYKYICIIIKIIINMTFD